jgi:hypothetical protein
VPQPGRNRTGRGNGSARRGISLVEGSVGRLFALLAVCAAAACEPAWSVQGHVRAADGSAAVAGALATLRCPGEADRTARSDRYGLSVAVLDVPLPAR